MYSTIFNAHGGRGQSVRLQPREIDGNDDGDPRNLWANRGEMFTQQWRVACVRHPTPPSTLPGNHHHCKSYIRHGAGHSSTYSGGVDQTPYKAPCFWCECLHSDSCRIPKKLEASVNFFLSLHSYNICPPQPQGITQRAAGERSN